ncbi:hypothetical protein [Lacisediminihabitans changchengi]|uniref:Uncharacterized protein n=1 Tax=Lacisediminihabitans changchengi TaxID=2787634 RepID=A0A934STS9_9MICO|nr:hypothetical protein [Lacisediminihabitans changchengi]MBK4348800.1 hypothetical protein [Lacisediminihabitans changchengi]
MTTATVARPNWRKVALIVLLALIGLQVVAWLTVFILGQLSIHIALGVVGGTRLQMILFWGGVACLLVLIVDAGATYARDHPGPASR